MNVSGKGVAEAWRAWNAHLPRLPPSAPPRPLGGGGGDDDEKKTKNKQKQEQNPRLVILHDELEAPWGKVKLKLGGSARGHNGLKSVMQALPGVEFARIGIGIGRPLSRDSDDVARYVLRQMSREELDQVRGCVGEVVRLLESL
jgi:PTH1 family peptidyl-tRNA hydrolase